MDRASVDRWLEHYVAAWKSYDEDAVKALFTEDAEYKWHPWDKPAVGPDAIYRGWIHPEARDEPGTYEAEYEAVAVEGSSAVATGTSTYFESPGGPVRTTYYNCFVMEFEGDRCKRFVEWFMEDPGR
jgi:ketosteroid isomerase-like protein